MFNIGHRVYIGGEIKKISMPNHYDYRQYRLTPDEVKMKFKEKSWDRVVAFQTRNPLHRAHIEMTMKSMKDLNAKLLLHPVVGMTKPGDVDHYTRVRCYKHVIEKYPKSKFIPEALYRLVEIYTILGMKEEAEKAASVIVYNYPKSIWYEDSYNLINEEYYKKNKVNFGKKILNLFKKDESEE